MMFDRPYESDHFYFVDLESHYDATGLLPLIFGVMAIYGSFYQNR